MKAITACIEANMREQVLEILGDSELAASDISRQLGRSPLQVNLVLRRMERAGLLEWRALAHGVWGRPPRSMYRRKRTA